MAGNVECFMTQGHNLNIAFSVGHLMQSRACAVNGNLFPGSDCEQENCQ